MMSYIITCYMLMVTSSQYIMKVSLMLQWIIIFIGSKNLNLATYMKLTNSFNYILINMTMTSMNFWLLLLTLWLMPSMITSSLMFKNKNKEFNLQILLILMLMMTLAWAFMTSSMIMYYLMFESSLIPTLLLIMKWGYQPERLNASLYMIMYTIIASLPLLMMLLKFMWNSSYIYWLSISTKYDFMNIFLVLAFFVKIPVYGLHLWLPKAHVEASVTGSMILASILLKLGVYGVYQITSMVDSAPFYVYSMMVVILGGGVLTTFICMFQSDMKSLIAYSSISHMALSTASIFSWSLYGKNGCVIVMLSHGMVSPLLFSLSSHIYESSKTRSLILTTGLKTLSPILSLQIFGGLVCNAGVPPTMNFAGEIICMFALMKWSKMLMLLLIPMTIMTMVYTANFYLYTQSNNMSSSSKMVLSSSSSKQTTLILITMPLFTMYSVNNMMN